MMNFFANYKSILFLLLLSSFDYSTRASNRCGVDPEQQLSGDDLECVGKEFVRRYYPLEKSHEFLSNGPGYYTLKTYWPEGTKKYVLRFYLNKHFQPIFCDGSPGDQDCRQFETYYRSGRLKSRGYMHSERNGELEIEEDEGTLEMFSDYAIPSGYSQNDLKYFMYQGSEEDRDEVGYWWLIKPEFDSLGVITKVERFVHKMTPYHSPPYFTVTEDDRHFNRGTYIEPGEWDWESIENHPFTNQLKTNAKIGYVSWTSNAGKEVKSYFKEFIECDELGQPIRESIMLVEFTFSSANRIVEEVFPPSCHANLIARREELGDDGSNGLLFKDDPRFRAFVHPSYCDPEKFPPIKNTKEINSHPYNSISVGDIEYPDINFGFTSLSCSYKPAF